jgi:putative endonuclease
MSGKTSYLAGLAAEDAVAADYARRGHPVAARRWRGSRGEIDLVLRDGDGLIIVEVKKARDFARAAARITAAQLERIYGAAAEFLAGEPRGQLTDMRLDVALVDGSGRLEIMENYWA